MSSPLGELGTTPTTLPTDKGEGATGHVGWTATVHTAVNALTAVGGIKGGNVGAGVLSYEHLTPAARARIAADVLALVQAQSGGPALSIPDIKVSTRLAAAQTTPVAMIYAGGSSTEGLKATTKAKRFVDLEHGGVQLAHPSGRPSGGAQSLETLVQDNPGGVGGFTTPNTTPGVHGYNIGKASTKSNDFVLIANIPALCALNPAAWHIMVGSNDCAEGVPVATYKTNMRAKLDAIRANMPAGAQYAIYLKHQYLRPATRNPTYAWALYGQALAELAAEDPATVEFIDLSAALPGVPGVNDAAALATGYIDADLIHMIDAGHKVWAAADYTATYGGTIPVGSPVTAVAGPVAGADNFDRTSTTTLGVTSTGGLTYTTHTGVMGTINGQAYCVTAPGLATFPAGLVDGQIEADLVWPANAGSIVGIRGRTNGSAAGLSLYANRDTGMLYLSAIINGAVTIIGDTAGYPAPAGTVAGSVVRVRLIMDGDSVAAVVAGNLALSATLTPAQQAAIDGNGIGIRILTPGVGGGTVDNFAYSSTIAPIDPPPVATSVKVTSSTTPAAFTAVASAGAATYAHTVAAGTTMLVVTVEATASSSASTVTAITYGGVAMTKRTGVLSSTSSTAREAAIWTLANPTVGTANVVLTARGAGGPFTLATQAISLTGTDGGLGTPVTQASASATTASTTTTATVNDLVVTVASVRSTTAVTGGAAVPIYNQLVGTNGAFAVSVQPGGSSVAAAYSWAVAGEAAIVSLPVIADTTTTTAPTLSVPFGNLPTWEQTRYETFPQAAAGPDWLRAGSSFYYNRGWRTYPNGGAGFGDTAFKASGILANSAWYHDKTTSVRLNPLTGKYELVVRIGYDAALAKNLTNYLMPDGYTGYVGARVDWVGSADVIPGYKLVCLWWDASNPDLWIRGEFDFPESNTIGTTFKFYVHDTLGTPSSNVRAVEPVMIPGNPTAPRMNVRHLYSLRWTDTEISCWLDNVKVASYAKPANGNGFPTTGMRYGFQIEALDLGGKTPISQTATGELRIEEVGVWRFNPAIV